MRKRTKQIIVRVSQEEKELINKKLALCKEKGLYKNYTDLFIGSITNTEIKIIDTSIIDEQLRGIANNVNQWTKNINTYNEVNKNDVENQEKAINEIRADLTEFKLNINK